MAAATLVLAGAGASAAEASVVGREGGELVVTFDPDEQIQAYSSTYGPSPPYEVVVDPAAGSVSVRNDLGGPIPPNDAGPENWPEQRSVQPGPGCAQAGLRTRVTCSLSGLSRIRVEFGTAAGPITTPRGRVLAAGILSIVGGSLPVVVRGGPNANWADIGTTSTVDADMADGNDHLGGLGPTAGTLAGGAGNDEIVTRVTQPSPAGAAVSGGPGNDEIITADDSTGYDVLPTYRHRVACGPGADVVIVDASDVVGDGCAPGATGLRTGMTLGRWGADGQLSMAPIRVRRALPVRFEVLGPRPPAFARFEFPRGPLSYGKRFNLRVIGRLRRAIPVQTRPAVRSVLRTRRAPLDHVIVNVKTRTGGAAGDLTSVFAKGTLRRGPRR